MTRDNGGANLIAIPPHELDVTALLADLYKPGSSSLRATCLSGSGLSRSNLHSEVMNLWCHSRTGRFEMELQRLNKVVKRNIGRLTLARDVDLQCLRHEPTVLLPDNRG